MKHDTPCAGCPWLAENQTPAAVAASPVDGRGVHWFAAENLRRHWLSISTDGAMLPCHMTDEKAPLYGGKPAKGGHLRICVGVTVLARREMMAFMASGTSPERYRARRPGRRFTMTALAAWASRLAVRGAVFIMGGRNYQMPSNVEDDPRVRLPWKDAVHG